MKQQNKDSVLWSQKLAQIGYEFLSTTKKNKNGNIDSFNPHASVKNSFDKVYDHIILYLEDSNEDAETLFFNLLSNNISAINDILTKKYDLGSISIGSSITPGSFRIIMHLLQSS